MSLGNNYITIDDVANRLMRNRDLDFFNCVAITGQVRRGKSTLCHHLIKRVYPEFTYEANYLGNPSYGTSFRTLFDTPPRSASWLDEAAKVLSPENRFSKEQSWLARLFEQFASHNKTIFLCTPSFLLIDSRWRRTHITLWIHVFARGKAVLLSKRDIQSSLDVWGLKAMEEKELSAKSDELTDERILQNFDKNPCAVAYFTFPDWETQEAKDEYIRYKTKSQEDLRSEFERWEKLQNELTKSSRSDIAIGRICAYMLWKFNTNYSELGKISGYSDDKIRDSVRKYIDLFITSEGYANAHSTTHFPNDYHKFILEKYNNRKSNDVLQR